MKTDSADIVVIGAGPVGLLCAHLGQMCGLNVVAIDKSSEPLRVGRADALNARTLQLFKIAGLFDELFPLGKACKTSSVWADGKFLSRNSAWWDALEGCLHKHFLMIGQAYVERSLDRRLEESGQGVRRETTARSIEIREDTCLTTLSSGEVIASRYVIGADGAHSNVRSTFNIPFEIERPEIIWAVIDGVIDSDFPKVPEIIVFQVETSDVAWIPREGEIDRFYVRMDRDEFSLEEAVEKINRALSPHRLRFRRIEWFSKFAVKEAVAERFSYRNRVFLAGDACHVHSVNGGQGLNTGIGDAFNLMWKLHRVLRCGAPESLLESYESERKPVAKSVIESSGELVRSTKFSSTGTHALDYVNIVQKRSGNITGMGIRYGGHGLPGTRLFDFELFRGEEKSRIYALLNYAQYTLLVLGDDVPAPSLPPHVQFLSVSAAQREEGLWTDELPYPAGVYLVRPDAYIEAVGEIHHIEDMLRKVLPS